MEKQSNKTKRIIISEEQFYKLIEDEYNSLLCEYFIKRSKYVNDKFWGTFLQIAQNWALCYYCNNVEMNERNYHHWRGELIDHLNYLWGYQLKEGDKLTASVEAFEKYFSYSLINVSIRNKFIHEQELETNDEIVSWITDEFLKDKDSILMCISNTSISSVIDYVDAKFPN